MPDEAITSAVTESAGLAERARRAARAVLREAAAAFERTPLEVLLAICAAIGFSVAVQQEAMDSWSHLLVTVACALPITAAASVLAERGAIPAPVRWAVSGAAVVSAALYGYYVFDPKYEAEAWRAWLLAGTACAALLSVPLIRPGGGDLREHEQRFIARLAARVIVVMAYAAALWGGLALALAAINGLFELHMSGKAWAHLASALFILLPPWAVAAGLPALLAPIEPWSASELRLLRRLGVFLLAPLVLVYLAIVYAYTVRVLATGEVPKNLVSPVVIGAGVLIVLTTFALEPVHEDPEAGGLSFLVRLSSPLLLPLVLFAIWAVSSRVGQYGWTEFRFLRLLVLALLAAFSAAALYRLVRRWRPPLTVVPAVLAVVLLLAAVGPWSATAVAHRSQAGALRHFLATAGRTGPGGSPAAVPPRVFRGITDKATYLQDHFGWAALRDVVPWLGERPAQRAGTDEFARRIGISERVGSSMLRVVDAQLPDERAIPGIMAGTLFVFDAHTLPEKPTPESRRRTGSPGQPPTPPLVVVDRTPGRLQIIVPKGDTLVADLAPLMQALLQRSAAETGQPIYKDRANDEEPLAETGRALNLRLEPGEVVRGAHTRAGQGVGQVVVRRITFEARPHAQAAAVALPPPPRDSLRIRSVGGFVILPAAAP